MKTRDLGQIDGPLLVFGGPYSNLQATQAFIQLAHERGIQPENCICLGDIVAYCGNPAETLSAVQDFGCAVLAGNCEKQLGIDANDCGCGFEAGSTCNALSVAWFAHCSSEITQSARRWMAELPDILTFTRTGKRFVAIHGGVTDVSRFLWPSSSASDFQEELDALTKSIGTVDVVLAAHSGIAFIRNINGTLWINAGAIGMPPHDGRPETRFISIGDGAPMIERLAYDHATARQAMKTAGLTQGYDLALTTGIWPSEDILPPALRR